jgi:ADP-heptose:LPS heptosyltransferase
MEILVVIDGGLVETLQASPLLRSLTAGLDGARITVACPPGAAEIAAHVPGVAEVMALRALGPATPRAGELARAYRALRRRRFHAAAVCCTRPRAAALVYFTGIPIRAGLASGPSALFFTDRVEREGAEENRAAAWLRLAPALGVPHQLHQAVYEPGSAARQVAMEHLVGAGFEDGRLMVALAPGTGFTDPLPMVSPRALSWEPERNAHLCNQLAHRHGAGIVVLGTAEDRPVVDAMLLDVASEVLDLCGELDGLDEIAAVLERCDLFISGDSPLLHLAAAVGTPSVGLFGPTDGRLRAPCGPEHRVIQAMPESNGARHQAPGLIDQPSLRQIRVDDVLAGIEVSALVER